MFRCITKRTGPYCPPDDTHPQDVASGPHLLIMCDDRNCPETATRNVNPGNGKEFSRTYDEFVTDLRKAGWMVNLDGQYCPQCTADTLATMQAADKIRKQREEAAKGMVQVANSELDIVKAKEIESRKRSVDALIRGAKATSS